MNPWDVDLIVVRAGLSSDAEQRALRREVERRRMRRVRKGIVVLEAALEGSSTEDKHVVALRAFAEVAPRPPVFSHWSAAVLHGLAVLERPRLRNVHTVVDAAGRRGHERVSGHVLPLLDEEVVVVGGLLVTSIGRTVIDVAAAGSRDEGVVTADAALAAGLPRDLLRQAVDLAGPRSGARKIESVVAFADGDSGSVGESVSRVTMDRLGVEPPVLQHCFHDHLGLAGILDFFFRRARSGGEFDGLIKYVDPRFAPQGAGVVIYEEKRREDRVRTGVEGLARWGWREARNPLLLAPILRAAGIEVPGRPLRR